MEEYKKIIKYISDLVNFYKINEDKNTLTEDTNRLEKEFDETEYLKIVLNKKNVKYIFKNTNGLSLIYSFDESSKKYSIILTSGLIERDSINLIENCYLTKNINNYALISEVLNKKIDASYYSFINGNGDYSRFQLNLNEWISFKYEPSSEGMNLILRYANKNSDISKEIIKQEAIQLISEKYSFTGVLNRYINDVYKFDCEKIINDFIGKKAENNDVIFDEYELLSALSENNEKNYDVVKECVKKIFKSYQLYESMPSLKEYFLTEDYSVLTRDMMSKLNIIELNLKKLNSLYIIDCYKSILTDFNFDIDVTLPMIVLHQKNPEKFAKFSFLRAFEDSFGILSNYADILTSSDDSITGSPIHQFLFFANDRLSFFQNHMPFYNCVEAGFKVSEKWFDIPHRGPSSPYGIGKTDIKKLDLLNDIIDTGNFNNVEFFKYMSICFSYYCYVKRIPYGYEGFIEHLFGHQSIRTVSLKECEKKLEQFYEEISNSFPVDNLYNIVSYIRNLKKTIDNNAILPTQILSYNPYENIDFQDTIKLESKITDGTPWCDFNVEIKLRDSDTDDEIECNTPAIESFYYGELWTSKNPSYNIFRDFIKNTYSAASKDEVLQMVEKTFFDKEIIKEYNETFKQFNKESIQKAYESDELYKEPTVSIPTIIVDEGRDISN